MSKILAVANYLNAIFALAALYLFNSNDIVNGRHDSVTEFFLDDIEYGFAIMHTNFN